jgi:hypothetical protein
MALALLSKKTMSLALAPLTTSNFSVMMSRAQSNQKQQNSEVNSGIQVQPPGPDGKPVKPFKFSPFDVSPANKVDFALARVDDLLNLVRRVSDYFLNENNLLRSICGEKILK